MVFEHLPALRICIERIWLAALAQDATGENMQSRSPCLGTPANILHCKGKAHFEDKA